VIGIEAINHYNGWSMAVAGALIVFAGLVILSLAIAQLPRFLLLLEKRKSVSGSSHHPSAANEDEGQPLAMPEYFPTDILEVVRFYRPLTEEIGPVFELSTLYALSHSKGFPHPHLSISAFRQANLLIPKGNGRFVWNTPLNSTA